MTTLDFECITLFWLSCIARVFFSFSPNHTMAEDFVVMDMSFLRNCATAHDPLEKGEEIASALDDLAEEDKVCFQCFMQARFKVFFEDDVKAQMKAMMSVQQWQSIYVRKECLAAVRCYLDWKKMFGEADLELATLDQSKIQVLSGVHCSEEERPKLRDALHKNLTAWLAALPGSIRTAVEEKVLVTTWNKEHFFGALVEFFELKKQASQPTTPPSLTQNPAAANLATPEKRTRTSAALPEYTGLSPAKCRVVEAENNVDSRFTPLDKVSSTCKIRHNVLGKVLMVGKIVNLKVGPNKDRLLPKFSYIIGSKTGTMEVSAIGQVVQRCFEQVTALGGQVASVSNTVFEKKYGTLSHGQNSLVQAIPGYDEEFDGVDFQVEELENVGNFKAWSRLSVIGCIRELQDPLPSERHMGQCYVDFFLQSRRGSGVAVRVSAGSAEMPDLVEDKEVFLKNFKVNADREQLYGDLADLSEISLWPDAGIGALYPVSVSQTITWQRR